MKDILLDIIQHTHGLGVVDVVKIVGTDKETQFFALEENKELIINGSMKTPVAEFIGSFGMGNLEKIKTVLSFEDFDEKAKINILREVVDGVDSPTSIRFENDSSDFVFQYRMISKSVVDGRVKTVNFKGTTWNVEFQPTVVGIQRLKRQASLNSDQTHMNIKNENGNIIVSLGDPSTHLGTFTFHSGATGKMTKTWSWPVKIFLPIMDLPGDKIVKISDAGVAEITVDSGISQWQYLIPCHSK